MKVRFHRACEACGKSIEGRDEMLRENCKTKNQNKKEEAAHDKSR